MDNLPIWYSTIDKIVKLTRTFGYAYWMPVSINRGTLLKSLPATFNKKYYDIAIGVEFKVH